MDDPRPGCSGLTVIPTPALTAKQRRTQVAPWPKLALGHLVGQGCKSRPLAPPARDARIQLTNLACLRTLGSACLGLYEDGPGLAFGDNSSCCQNDS